MVKCKWAADVPNKGRAKVTLTNTRVVSVDDLTTDQLLDVLRAKAATVPALDWITKSGRDLVAIAVCMAGFDCKELVGRLARARSRGVRINAATVTRIMGEMVHA